MRSILKTIMNAIIGDTLSKAGLPNRGARIYADPVVNARVLTQWKSRRDGVGKRKPFSA